MIAEKRPKLYPLFAEFFYQAAGGAGEFLRQVYFDSYKQVAARAGNPRAARAVGTLMSHNYDEAIPCHRVIRSDGKVGDYNRGGPSRKIELLLEEAYRR